MSKSSKRFYVIMTIGSLVGLVASFLDTLEKIALLKNAHSILTCNLNTVFSCSNVLNARQSSVFGFPNSLLCLVFFSLTLSMGLVGWANAKIVTARLRLGYQALALFFAGFGFWFFWQSIFNLHSLCILCIFCYLGVLLINGSWLRLNSKDYHVNKRIRQFIDHTITSGADIFFWCLIALVITLLAILKLK